MESKLIDSVPCSYCEELVDWKKYAKEGKMPAFRIIKTRILKPDIFYDYYKYRSFFCCYDCFEKKKNQSGENKWNKGVRGCWVEESEFNIVLSLMLQKTSRPYVSH